MAVATFADVEVAIGRPVRDGNEINQIEWWLNGVEMFIKSRLGDVSLLDQDIVKYVEVEAILGKVRRSGQSESSITVAVDDGTVTRRYENPVTSDDVTADLWSLFTPKQSATAYTVGVSSPLDVIP